MNIKWQLVIISALTVAVVILYQSNIQLETEKTGRENLITQLIEENVEIDEKKAEMLRDARILKNEWTGENKKPVKIEKVYRMGRKELEEVIIEKISGNNESSDIIVTMPDRLYYYPSKGTWDDIIKENETETYIPIKEVFDCDDFMSKFKSDISATYLLNSVGEVRGKNKINEAGHAWNIFLVRENGENVLYFFEPQTDEIFPIGPEISVFGETFTVEAIEW